MRKTVRGVCLADDERIIFVLSLNKEQLVHTITNYYGNEFDATRYLKRFFDISINLPELDSFHKQKTKCFNSSNYWLTMIADELSDYYNIDRQVIENDYYKSLYEDKLEGIITQEDFVMFKEKFSKEIDEYKNRIEIIDLELSEIKSKEENISTTTEIFKKYKQIKELNREIIDEFIDAVLIGKINPETNEREIDIEMNVIKLD